MPSVEDRWLLSNFFGIKKGGLLVKTSEEKQDEF